MELAPLVPAFGEQEGSLEINTEISEASAIEIEKHLDRFFGYYHYERVTLKLNSPGGTLAGLEHILECIGRWRERGREVRALVMFRAASAAALLLALGEVGSRNAHRNSALLFHHARVGGAQCALTSGAAGQLASVLRMVDQEMVQRIVGHCRSGFGGGMGVALEGAVRCQWLRDHGLEIAVELGVTDLRRPLKWLPPMLRMWTDCVARSSLSPLSRHLAERFDEDSGMDLREAWALCLLDQVKGVRRLQAQIREFENPPGQIQHPLLVA